MELRLREEPLPLLLLVLLDMAARVAAVRAQAPGFCQVEHLPDHFEDPVRLVGRVPVLVVQIGDVLALDLGDRHVAQVGQHEFLDQPATRFDRPRLAPNLDMLDQIPLGEFGDGGSRRLLRGVGLRVLPGLDAGNHLGRLAPRLVGRDHAVSVDGDALGLAAHPCLDDVDLGPVGIDANTKTGQVPVPVDGLLVADRQLPDGPLRDGSVLKFGHFVPLQISACRQCLQNLP